MSLTAEDLQDIQAGPVVPVPTRSTVFIVFAIKDVDKFRDIFQKRVLPSITTSDAARTFREEVEGARNQGKMAPVTGINVSFSHKGLIILGLADDIGDAAFKEGQFKSAESLGDKSDNWLPEFKGGPIHGLISVTGYPRLDVSITSQEIKDTLTSSSAITVIYEHSGQTRPGDLKGHEHFGFNDGISQPFVEFGDDEVSKRKSSLGQTVVDPGVLILGHTGDELKSERPDWAKNGSFVVYRQLKQLVPEFNVFLEATVRKPIYGMEAITDSNAEAEKEIKKRADFLGARLMGRWKSGSPVVKTLTEQGKIPEDPHTKNDDLNHFDYGLRNETPRNQVLCPFAAHTRKTGPRTDIPEVDAKKHMIRRGGIPYGPELQAGEKTNTEKERGLLFVSYQSSVVEGFEFIQKKWSNESKFPSETAGIDPIIGQNGGKERTMTGYDANKPNDSLKMSPENQFVISQGGEYFFLPSMKTLNQIFPQK